MKKTSPKQSNKVYWIVAEISPKNAGYRVRSLPIAREAAAFGLEFEFVALSEFPQRLQAIAASALAVIVAKPADTTTELCMRHLAERNVRVIVDLFDNYFSWSGHLDRRGIHWHWMRGLQAASTIVVSTPFLRNTVERLTDKPVVYVADPTPLPAYAEASEAKWASKWCDRGQLRLLWFGIPGNPFFPAGLDDLLSWVDRIAAFQDRVSGFASMTLTICTNRIPQLEGVLAAFRRAGVFADFVQWTQADCDLLLDDAHIVLLPTNATGFSLSKTHNRCSDALARNCLVWASPNGPYRDVPGGVHFGCDDVAAAVTSSGDGEIIEAIKSGLQYICGAHPPRSNARRLADAIRQAVPVRTKSMEGDGRKLLVVGQTTQAVVKLSRTMGYLTCNFAGSRTPWNFDIYLDAIDVHSSSVTLRLTDMAMSAFAQLIDDEMESHDESTGTTRDGIRIQLLRDMNACLLTCQSIRPVLQRLDAMREGRLEHPMLYERWVDANVGLLASLLWRVGFRDIELAHDEPGVWHDYAEAANPELADMARCLSRLRHEHRGNEIAWGESVVQEHVA